VIIISSVHGLLQAGSLMIKQAMQIAHVKGQAFLLNYSSWFNLCGCWCKMLLQNPLQTAKRITYLLTVPCLWVLRFLQKSSWGFCSSRIWCFNTGQSDIDVLKERTNNIFKDHFFILLQSTDRWRWSQLVPSKCQDPTSPWWSTISQKNGIFSAMFEVC